MKRTKSKFQQRLDDAVNQIPEPVFYEDEQEENTTDAYIFDFGHALFTPTLRVYGNNYQREGSIIHVYSINGDTVVDLSIYGSMTQEINQNFEKE